MPRPPGSFITLRLAAADFDPETGRPRERTPEPPKGAELARARRLRRRIELHDERRRLREELDW